MLCHALEDLAMREQAANVVLAGLFITAAEGGSIRRLGNFQCARARLRRFGRGHQVRHQHESGSIEELLRDRGQSWHSGLLHNSRDLISNSTVAPLRSSDAECVA